MNSQVYDGYDVSSEALKGIWRKRHLKKKDNPVSIINDKQFELTRKSLQSKQKVMSFRLESV